MESSQIVHETAPKLPNNDAFPPILPKFFWQVFIEES
jgi:hypothetical protein